MAAAPRPASAQGRYEYQLELHSTLLYSTHWFSGRDPGYGLDPTDAQHADAMRREVLIPPVLLWRNALGLALYYDTPRTHWDLRYSFGYDYFVERQAELATPATATTPAVLSRGWTGASRLDSFENRFNLIGRLDLDERTTLVLAEELVQSRYNLFSAPLTAAALTRTVNGFDISGLTYLGNTTRATLDMKLAELLEMRPELEVQALKVFGSVPPELGNVLSTYGLFTLRDTLLRRFERDVFEVTGSAQYAAVSTPPPIPNPDPSLPPISQAAFGRDYLVFSAKAGWAHRFTPWLLAYAHVGWAGHMFATHHSGDRVYNGAIGGLRLTVHDDRWSVVGQYTRGFETSLWGASVINDDLGVLSIHRRLGEVATPWLDLTIDHRNLQEPNGVPPVAPTDPALGVPVTVAQYVFYGSLGTTFHINRSLGLDVFVNYKRQWGPGAIVRYDSWTPGVMLSVVWPERRLARTSADEVVRRLTREPFEEDRSTDREREAEDAARARTRQERDANPVGLDDGGVPRRRRPPANAPADWGGTPSPQPAPEGTAAPRPERSEPPKRRTPTSQPASETVPPSSEPAPEQGPESRPR